MPSRAFNPIAATCTAWNNIPMKSEDPFITGLRQFFTLNPQFKPATVSAAAGLDKSAIRKMLEGSIASPRNVSMNSIADVLGTTVEAIIGQTFDTDPSAQGISVAGRVGAGAVVDLVDDHAKGDGLYHIECPPQIAPSGVVAVEVTGESMIPVYHPGDVLLYSRTALGVPSEALNRICVCEDAAGQVWVKQVRTGTQKGLFNLISANPSGINMLDVALTWAAPVRLHLPVEFVKRLD